MLHPFRVLSFTRLKPVVCASLRPPATISQPSRLPFCAIFPEHNLFSFQGGPIQRLSARYQSEDSFWALLRGQGNAGTTGDHRKQTVPYTEQ
jgi:hypothetical protein